MTGQKKIVNAASAEAKELLAEGWQVVARSWGAGLDLASLDTDRIKRLRNAPSDFAIRPLTAADVDAVVQLDKETYRDFPGDIATLREPVTAAEAAPSDVRLAWGAFSGNELAGMLYADIDGWHGNGVEIDFYSVSPALRGQGIGKALLATAILKLTADGVTSIRTGVADENDASIAALESVGFVRDEEWVTLEQPK